MTREKKVRGGWKGRVMNISRAPNQKNDGVQPVRPLVRGREGEDGGKSDEEEGRKKYKYKMIRSWAARI